MTKTPNRSAVCCLYDGDYHLGLGALVNSLYRSGFRGVVWAGYRGETPPWAVPLTDSDAYREFVVAEGCAIRFVKLELTVHMTQAKPSFILDIFDRLAPDVDKIFFFDVDIVVKCPWPFFEDWANRGAALCLDGVYPYMPATHPLRGHWRTLAGHFGFECRAVDGYVNGGFLGVHRDNACLVETWCQFLDHAPSIGVDLSRIHGDDRSDPYFSTDQDMLNAAIMACDVPLSVAGPDAMDFVPGGYIMSHAILNPKPWQRNYVVSSLKGVGPATADKMYWKFADGPVHMFAPGRVKAARVQLKLASALGRVYQRR